MDKTDTEASTMEPTVEGPIDISESRPAEEFKIPTNPRRFRRSSVSAECSTYSSSGRACESKIHPKSPEETANIENAMKENFLFEGLGKEDKQKVCNAMTRKIVEKDFTVILQGQEGDFFYMLDEGCCDVFVNKIKVFEYRAGSFSTTDCEDGIRKVCCFGELALMYNCPRAATIVTSSKCYLWVLDRQSFRSIVSSRYEKQTRTRDEFLSQCELFKGLSKTEITKISDVMKEETFADGTLVIEEGDADFSSMKFYLILEGAAEAYKKFEKSRDEKNAFRKKAETSPHFKSTAVDATRVEIPPDPTLNLDVTASPNSLRLPQISPTSSVTGTNELEKEPDLGTSGVCANVADEKIDSVEYNEKVGFIGVGQFFGEKALVEKTPRAASVRAVGKLVCGVIDVASFERLLGNGNELLKREIDKYRKFNESVELSGEISELPEKTRSMKAKRRSSKDYQQAENSMISQNNSKEDKHDLEQEQYEDDFEDSNRTIVTQATKEDVNKTWPRRTSETSHKTYETETET